MPPELKKIHPLRRKHRRGKRGGKKHKRDALTAILGPQLVALPVAPVTPQIVAGLRARLHQLTQLSTSKKAG